MALKIEVVTQTMLVRHGDINGEKHFREYGWDFIWILDTDNSPPKLLGSGVVPTQTLNLKHYGSGDDSGRISKKLLPVVRDVNGRTALEGFGIVNG